MTLDARSRARRRWTLAFAVVAVVGVTWVIVSATGASDLERFERSVAELKAAGYATSMAELRDPALPAAENGAAEFDAAMAMVPALVGDEGTWTVPGPWSSDVQEDWHEHPSPADAAAVAAFLAKLAPFFERLDAAAQKPHLRWESEEAADPWFASDTTIPPLQQCQKLLTERTVADPSPSGRVAGALTSLRIARRAQASSLIQSMVFEAYASAAVCLLRRQIELGNVTAAEARPLVDPEIRWSALDEFPQRVRLETVWVLSAVRASLTKPVPANVLLDDIPWYAKPFSGSVAVLPHTLRRIAEIPPRPVGDAIRACDEALDDAARVEKPVLVVYSQILRRSLRTDAQFALCRVGLALKEHRERTGAWPASLDDLRGAFPGETVPLDPFTDAPFRYSAGDDGVDSGVVRLASAGCLPGTAVPPAAAQLHEEGLSWELPRDGKVVPPK